MNAMMMKLMIAAMNAPKSIGLSAGPTLSMLVISSMLLPAIVPMMRLISGVMIFSQSAVTIALNAPPIITPTARSSTLPRLMNSLNSPKNFFIDTFLLSSFL